MSIRRVQWEKLAPNDVLQCGDMWASCNPNTPERQSGGYNLQMQAVNVGYYGMPAGTNLGNGDHWRPSFITAVVGRVLMSYNEMNQKVSDIIRASGNESKVIYSMYEWADEANRMVWCHDFTESYGFGDVTFYRGNKQFPILEAPTWGDVLVVANFLMDDDHRFLEGVERQDDGRVLIQLGS